MLSVQITQNLEQNNIRQLLGRAQILMEQPRYDLAEGKLKEVLALEPNHSEALGLLAYATNRLKKYAIAKKYAESTLNLDPSN